MRDGLVWLIGLIWLSGVTFGLYVWDRYENTPGTVGMETAIPAPGGWRLTVFLHPRCPCSRATLNELAEMVVRQPDLAVRVVFVRPIGVPEGWERGAGWDAALKVHGIDVDCDADGTEAIRAGAVTSGHAILVDPAGGAVFRGGLTRGRGDDAGRRTIHDWMQKGSGPAAAPVYGCALFDPVD